MQKLVPVFVMAVCMICCLTMTSCSAEEVPAISGRVVTNSAALTSEIPSTFTFTDVPSDAWYAEAISYCWQYGIMSGTSATTFAPETPLSRAMLATVLYRMAGSPAVLESLAFTDVAPDLWYSDAVSWAAKNGVISGYGNGTFGVDDSTTWEQAITILWRYAGNPESSDADNFSDVSSISDWAKSAICWANANGILDGMMTHGRFAPKANIKRGEVASMLYNYMKLNTDSQSNQTDPDSGKVEFNFETKRVTLNSGYEMPILGLGTYSLSNEECYNSVTTLLDAGGRLIDTAYMYGNEVAVGRAVRDSDVPREEIFVITKLYPGQQYANPEKAIQDALKKLDIGYIDMMLLHHPGTNDVKAYKAMEQAVAEGKIHSLGLSNWYINELEEFLPQVTVIPALVQNEIHPYYQENEVIPFIQEKGIVVQGWYPFGGRGHTKELLGDETITAIAQAHGVSSAQVILRWNLQKSVVVIPGSSNPDHIRENLDLFGFELTKKEVEQINALDREEKHDWY